MFIYFISSKEVKTHALFVILLDAVEMFEEGSGVHFCGTSELGDCSEALLFPEQRDTASDLDMAGNHSTVAHQLFSLHEVSHHSIIIYSTGIVTSPTSFLRTSRNQYDFHFLPQHFTLYTSYEPLNHSHCPFITFNKIIF